MLRHEGAACDAAGSTGPGTGALPTHCPARRWQTGRAPHGRRGREGVHAARDLVIDFAEVRADGLEHEGHRSTGNWLRLPRAARPLGLCPHVWSIVQADRAVYGAHRQIDHCDAGTRAWESRLADQTGSHCDGMATPQKWPKGARKAPKIDQKL